MQVASNELVVRHQTDTQKTQTVGGRAQSMKSTMQTQQVGTEQPAATEHTQEK